MSVIPIRMFWIVVMAISFFITPIGMQRWSMVTCIFSTMLPFQGIGATSVERVSHGNEQPHPIFLLLAWIVVACLSAYLR